MVDNPTAQRWIFLPDASGTLVVAAAAPLFLDATGTVSLLQTSITAVGALQLGSLTRSFGELQTALLTLPVPIWVASVQKLFPEPLDPLFLSFTC